MVHRIGQLPTNRFKLSGEWETLSNASTRQANKGAPAMPLRHARHWRVENSKSISSPVAFPGRKSSRCRTASHRTVQRSTRRRRMQNDPPGRPVPMDSNSNRSLRKSGQRSLRSETATDTAAADDVVSTLVDTRADLVDESSAEQSRRHPANRRCRCGRRRSMLGTGGRKSEGVANPTGWRTEVTASPFGRAIGE